MAKKISVILEIQLLIPLQNRHVWFFCRMILGNLPKNPGPELMAFFFLGGGIPLNPLNLGWARRFGRYNLPK